MNKLKAIANKFFLSVTATLLATLESVLAYFPGLSQGTYTPQTQEIEPDFYR